MKLAKTYDPKEYESTVYQMWEASGAFNPSGKGEPFSIVMPPPNANGNLHLGHALTVTLEDILVRYYRMNGRDSIYIPGADHAGLETWVVYERLLEKKGKSRFDFTREELYSQVWDFVAGQRGNMEGQLRMLGASASWDNQVFTLDKMVVNTVYDTFKKLWDEGLIYRGKRIVNYSTKYKTGYADIEVDYKNKKGKLYDIAYAVPDADTEIVVATTRPETMLGDTAIAVHPDDKRYKDLVGKTAELPLTDREIPIIADKHVDPEYGTGAVKVTPAHDINDFEIGERHDLPRITVIDFDGKMTGVDERFNGLDVEEARKEVLKALKEEGRLRGTKDIEHSVGYDYKSGLPIQPLLMDQWFLKIKPLADEAKKAIKAGKISFTPESKKRVLLQYLDNLKDWNISRQIPWGIPIPAYQNEKDPEDWIFYQDTERETIEVDGEVYRRDDDTFDTWFSSGQWPFVVTNALEEDGLSRFYPNSVMETGVDLIDRWVARMIMLGLYATNEIPFKHVYMHGMVLDEQGQKMSKSKGNVINPIDIVEEYGVDALRIGIVGARSAGQNQAFNKGKVLAGRNFANKLWNVARFIENKLPSDFKPDAPKCRSISDHWIARQLSEAAAETSKMIESYRFAEASEVVYHAMWDDLADWYIEVCKTEDNPNVLAWSLMTVLKIAHPFAPFVTETIWQTLGWDDKLLISSSWPEKIDYDEIAAAEFDRLKKLILEVRYIDASLEHKGKLKMVYLTDSLIEDNKELIKSLAKLGDITHVDQGRGMRLAASGREAWLDIDEETLYNHQTNLEVRLAETKVVIENLKKRLDNPNYVEKAPAKLVEETKKQLEEKEDLAKRLSLELDVLR